MSHWILFSLIFPLLNAVLQYRDDGELIDRLKRRDPQAMSTLYDRYGRLCYSIILRIVRNEAVAEDLVQETFLRVWNRVQGFDPARGALGPWILTVARNRSIDYLRSFEGRGVESAFEIDRLEHPALFVDLENSILNSDRVRVLREAFHKLESQPAHGDRTGVFRGPVAIRDGRAPEAAAGNGEELGADRAAVVARGDGRGAGGIMTHEEMGEMYELYALGSLDREERDEIGEHLGTGCAVLPGGRATGGRPRMP